MGRTGDFLDRKHKLYTDCCADVHCFKRSKQDWGGGVKVGAVKLVWVQKWLG